MGERARAKVVNKSGEPDSKPTWQGPSTEAFEGGALVLRLSFEGGVKSYFQEMAKLKNVLLDETGEKKNSIGLKETFPMFSAPFLNRILGIYEGIYKIEKSDQFSNDFHWGEIYVTNPDFYDHSYEDQEVFVILRPKTSSSGKEDISYDSIVQRFSEFVSDEYMLKFEGDTRIEQVLGFARECFSVDEESQFESPEFVKAISLLGAYYSYADMILDKLDMDVGDVQGWPDLDPNGKDSGNSKIFDLGKYFIILESMFLVHRISDVAKDECSKIAGNIRDSLEITDRYECLKDTYKSMSEHFEKKTDSDAILQAIDEGHRDVLITLFGLVVTGIGFFLALETKEHGAFFFAPRVKDIGVIQHLMENIITTPFFAIMSVTTILLGGVLWWVYSSRKKSAAKRYLDSPAAKSKVKSR
ncbi:MAG: hypothetical protein KC478_10680 [Bacteriovoracaceae bacterium]|nr:hypothetical protein [Bacteriovoracaceae bacterium]